MIDEDDGIPVLTDVLRLGSGPVALHGSAAIAPADASNEGADDALDGSTLTDQLVIGNDTEPSLESYLQDPEDDEAHAWLPANDPVEDFEDASEASGDAANAEAFVETHLGQPVVADSLTDDADLGPVEEHVAEDREPSTIDEGALVDASKPGTLDDDAFVARLRESMLEDLHTRIDTELDARLAQAMRAEIENALGGLQVQLREHLGDALRDVVRRSVDDEIVRLRATRGE